MSSNKNPAPSTLPQRLLQQIAQIEGMERGKLCVMREGPTGPYYNHQNWEDGKNVSRYVPQEEVADLQKALAGYQTFQSLSEQYVDLIVKRTRQERSAAQKKDPPLNSSGPSRKKSRS